MKAKKDILDNRMAMVNWWKALEVPFGRVQATKMRTDVEDAISELAVAFPPSRLKFSGHQFEEALE